MVYKSLKLIIIYLFIGSINLNANIIFSKKDISISKIEFDFYKDIFNQQNNEGLNKNQIIKKIYLIKSTILFYKKNNPEILEIIDNKIMGNSIETKQLDNLEINYLRYTTLSNEFLINYFRNEFKIQDLEIVISNFNKLNLPLSLDKCLTIIRTHDLKDNYSFYENFYYNLMNNTKNFTAQIDDKDYYICINSSTFEIIEKEIIIYIQNKSKKKFDNFLYEKLN